MAYLKHAGDGTAGASRPGESGKLENTGDADDLLISCDSCSGRPCYYRQILWGFPDATVPDALVFLGLLTNHLDPEDTDRAEYKKVARKSVPPLKSTSLSQSQVDIVAMLLRDASDIVDPQDKKLVGTVCEFGGLNKPNCSSEDVTDDVFAEAFSSEQPDDPDDSVSEEGGNSKRTGRSSGRKGGRESIVQKANKKAKAQGRDAAIDPRLNKVKGNKNHLLNPSTRSS